MNEEERKNEMQRRAEEHALRLTESVTSGVREVLNEEPRDLPSVLGRLIGVLNGIYSDEIAILLARVEELESQLRKEPAAGG